MSARSHTPPRVTIGLPVYNGEKFLGAAIDSILAQTFTDFELIVSDNASTDGTAEIARQYEARDSRVLYVRHPRNIGIAGNFWGVVTRARGELLRWVAVDDLCRPEAVARCVEALDANPSAVLAYTHTEFIDENDEPRSEFKDYVEGMHLVADRPSDRFFQSLGNSNWCNPQYGVIRAETLRRTRGLGAYRGSDIVLLAELSLFGTFIEVPERLFLRRVHDDAMTAKSEGDQQHEYTPGRPQVAYMREWRHLWELWRAAMHAPISWTERARISVLLLRRARWNRDVLARELLGRASGFIPKPTHLPHRGTSA
ncbi:MAG TPA: glycosyltransferase family A protein [Gemmatimonadaceae bacterium]|nr:glycosyltransferase family A protein [Gemmatimonadaceae bacterium]